MITQIPFNLRTWCSAALVVGAATSATFAAPFTATYDFTGYSGNGGTPPVPTVANATFSTFSRVNVAEPAGSGHGSNIFNSNGWQLGGSAPDLTEYVTFTVTPAVGYELDLSTITFGSQRSNTGPQSGQIRYSRDGFTSFGAFSPPTSIANSTWNFADVVNSTAPITFRFYGWGGTGATGTLRFDNVAITGDVSAIVPEPASLALAATGGLLILARRRQA